MSSEKVKEVKITNLEDEEDPNPEDLDSFASKFTKNQSIQKEIQIKALADKLNVTPIKPYPDESDKDSIIRLPVSTRPEDLAILTEIDSLSVPPSTSKPTKPSILKNKQKEKEEHEHTKKVKHGSCGKCGRYSCICSKIGSDFEEDELTIDLDLSDVNIFDNIGDFPMTDKTPPSKTTLSESTNDQGGDKVIDDYPITSEPTYQDGGFNDPPSSWAEFFSLDPNRYFKEFIPPSSYSSVIEARELILLSKIESMEYNFSKSLNSVTNLVSEFINHQTTVINDIRGELGSLSSKMDFLMDDVAKQQTFNNILKPEILAVKTKLDLISSEVKLIKEGLEDDDVDQSDDDPGSDTDERRPSIPQQIIPPSKSQIEMDLDALKLTEIEMYIRECIKLTFTKIITEWTSEKEMSTIFIMYHRKEMAFLNDYLNHIDVLEGHELIYNLILIINWNDKDVLFNRISAVVKQIVGEKQRTKALRESQKKSLQIDHPTVSEIKDYRIPSYPNKDETSSEQSYGSQQNTKKLKQKMKESSPSDDVLIKTTRALLELFEDRD